MYMYVKLPPEDLNHDTYPSHLISTYTCKVTIALRVCGGRVRLFLDEQAFVYANDAKINI